MVKTSALQDLTDLDNTTLTPLDCTVSSDNTPAPDAPVIKTSPQQMQQLTDYLCKIFSQYAVADSEAVALALETKYQVRLSWAFVHQVLLSEIAA